MASFGSQGAAGVASVRRVWKMTHVRYWSVLIRSLHFWNISVVLETSKTCIYFFIHFLGGILLSPKCLQHCGDASKEITPMLKCVSLPPSLNKSVQWSSKRTLHNIIGNVLQQYVVLLFLSLEVWPKQKEWYWLLLLNWDWEQWSDKDKSALELSESLELPEEKAWWSEQFSSEYG